MGTQIGTFWDRASGIAALPNLLLNAVTLRLGPAAGRRVARLSALGEHFEAFGYEPARPAAGRTGAME